MSETPTELPPLLTRSDFQSIVGILWDRPQWGSTNSRRSFAELALLDYSKASLLIGELKLDTGPREAAEEVLLALSKAGEDAAGIHPLPLFLRHLAGKLTEISKNRLVELLALQVKLVGLVRSVSPAILGDAYRRSVQGLPVDRYLTLAGQIRHLLDLEPGQGPVVPLLVFAARLSDHDAGLGDRFRLLAEPFARETLRASAAQILASRSTPSVNSSPAGHHTVAIVAKPNGNNPGQEARNVPLLVQLFYWKPGQRENPEEYPEGGAVELNGADELAQWVRQWIPYALANGGTETPEVLVEFFLPTALLSLPVDTWEIESDESTEVLGFTYAVVVRALNRYRDPQKIALMRPRVALPSPEIHWHEPPYPGERYNYVLAKHPQRGCLVLSHTSCCHETNHWVYGIQAGIPWGVWVRRGIAASREAVRGELINIVGDLVVQEPLRLPARVKEARLEVAPGVSGELDPLARQVRENLSLLFEDPDRYPPRLEDKRNPKAR